MSTAWKSDVVLLREPTSALWLRLGGRILRASAAAVLAIFVPWAWLSWLFWVATAFFALLVIATVINWARARGVMLVLRGSGAIERPRSIQEVVLRRPLEYVAGADIVVEEDFVIVPGRAGARMTLRSGDQAIVRTPLYGEEPRDWVERANVLAEGRGVNFRFVERPPIDAEASDDSGLSDNKGE